MKNSTRWTFIAFAVGLVILRGGERPADATQARTLKINASRLSHRIEKLAEYGKTPEGGVHRVAFSNQDIASRKYILSLMKEAGLRIRIDEAGNIIGRREGKVSSLPPIGFGSHTDT
ncbi:MAG: Zn-dependent hydrolase, partial [Candidatus Aminicenantales bacterium]